MDVEYIEKLLGEIRKSIETAKVVVNLDINNFISDFRNRYTLRMLIIEIIEASANIGIHILREDFNIQTLDSYSEIFRKLVENRVLSHEIGMGIEKLCRLRNLIIHRYWDVDDLRIYSEAKGNGLGIIEGFVREVEEYASRFRKT